VSEDAPASTDGLVARRRRVILVTAGIALGSLVLGMVVGGRVTSPGDAAARARPPDAGDITVPVERRELRSEVTTRGDVVYDGATDVVIATSDLGTPPVVTGQVPEVGATIEAGAVVLQVVGRPVLALTGDVPAYRTLSPGITGPDVLQLKAALVALGLSPGDANSDLYDKQTSAAVAELYARAGYAPPVADETITQELEAARESQTSAREGVISAQQALTAAGRPPTESDRLQAEAVVSAAQRELTDAEAAGDPTAIANARDQLAIAEAQRDEALAPKDTSAEQAAVTQAQAGLTEANTQVADLELQAGTPLPLAEVVFLPNLPRRVDAVSVSRGKTIDGPVMQVSGSDLVVVARLTGSDVELVREGATAQLQVGDDTVDGTVQTIRDPTGERGGQGGEGDQGSQGGEGAGGDGGDDRGAGGGDRQAGREAVIKPGALTPEQVEVIRGQNVRVTIPVEATQGEVLAVPLAALSAGAGGESRIEVQRADDNVERVAVEVGLAAGGYAEVRAVRGSLEEGDLVVVGR
jgi:hypothetical protein